MFVCALLCWKQLDNWSILKVFDDINNERLEKYGQVKKWNETVMNNLAPDYVTDQI